MMAADEGPVVQGEVLRSDLIRLRKAKGLTQEEVARNRGWRTSKLIRIEGGSDSITEAELSGLLLLYDVTAEAERERLRILSRGALEVGWWIAYRDEISAPYLNYVGYEAGTTFVRQFPGSVIPGLLQTAEYADALTASALDHAQLTAVVGLRLQRQAELAARSVPPRQYYVLDESVIRRHVGIERDRAIMPAQLGHIADMTVHSDLITVRVVPFQAGAHAGLSGPFTLLEFDGGLPDLLYLDTGQGEFAYTTSDRPRVAEYADKFELIVDRALPERESIDFIRRAAGEMS
jgi:transcriptional regulator with XRE-family HTH domain